MYPILFQIGTSKILELGVEDIAGVKEVRKGSSGGVSVADRQFSRA